MRMSVPATVPTTAPTNVPMGTFELPDIGSEVEVLLSVQVELLDGYAEVEDEEMVVGGSAKVV